MHIYFSACLWAEVWFPDGVGTSWSAPNATHMHTLHPAATITPLYFTTFFWQHHEQKNSWENGEGAEESGESLGSKTGS